RPRSRHRRCRAWAARRAASPGRHRVPVPRQRRPPARRAAGPWRRAARCSWHPPRARRRRTTPADGARASGRGRRPSRPSPSARARRPPPRPRRARRASAPRRRRPGRWARRPRRSPGARSGPGRRRRAPCADATRSGPDALMHNWWTTLWTVVAAARPVPAAPTVGRTHQSPGGPMSGTQSDHPLAVVTGASSGIGREVAILLAEQGYDLVVCADDAEIHTVLPESAGLTVEPVQADLSTYDGVEDLLDAVGDRDVDALVLNAGV